MEFIPIIAQQEKTTSLPFFSQEPFLSKEEIEKLKADIDGLFEKIGELSGEIWIGKKDFLLYRFRGEKTFDLKTLIKEEGKFLVRIKVNLEFSKFNQPVGKIEAPQEYKTFEELLGEEFFKPSAPELPETAPPLKFPKRI